MASQRGEVEVKSRKEKRKESRQAKRQKHLHQWAVKQAGKLRRGESLVQQSSPTSQDGQRSARSDPKKGARMATAGKGKKRPRTKFQEYLEMESKQTLEEGLEMERMLAKRLKVKGGKLKDNSDGLLDILDGMGSALDYADNDTSARGADDEDISGQPGKRKTSDKPEARAPKRKKITVFDEEPEVTEDSHSDEEGSLGFGGEDQVTDDSQEDLSEGSAEEAHVSDEFEKDVSEASRADDDMSMEEIDEVDAGHSSDRKEDTAFEAGKNAANTVAAGKYVPPHLRGSGEKKSEEMIRLQRRVRGLLNRLSEANVEPIVTELSSMFQVHGRRVIGDFITEEIVAACCGGPRGNEQFAAVFAAFVAGIAAVIGIDFGAKFLSSLAVAFEEQYKKGDGLALRNLTLLLSNMFLFQLLSSDLVYDLLGVLCKRFEELDVATILCLLQSCGFPLRGDDPAAMKELILSVQSRTADLKAVLSEDKAPMGKRVEFMLDTICDIKNNKKRQKDNPAHHTRLKKWLKKLGVEEVQLRAVTWTKLLDPEKKGQWWLAGGNEDDQRADVRIEVAGAIDAGAAEAERMLQLAASQRMNTDARRSVFCVVMSGEDYMDAFEKLLRLKLPGKQDREMLRVIVECCLQEKIFNKYYALLASKLCHHDKNHKFTLQYCLWDHFKQLESMEIRRISNLARLVAELIGSFALSMTVLKVVDFADVRTLTSKVVMHFGIVFRVLLTEYPEDVVWAAFSRIAAAPELSSFRDGLTLFLHRYVRRLDSSESKDGTGASLLSKRCRLAKKALSNVVGVLL